MMEVRKRLQLRQIAEDPLPLHSGNALCPGCAESIIVNTMLMEKEKDAGLIVVLATGCLEVSTTSYPTTFWGVPVLHGSFDTAAGFASGVEQGLMLLRKRGKLDRKIHVVVFGGDGGTYDIGLQSLSGMLERGHQITYVCLDNEGYMNTGGQRSSASSAYADTATMPRSTVTPGDRRRRKDLMAIVAAHGVEYAAQTAPNTVKVHDLRDKARAALSANGPSFLNVLSPCARGWGFHGSDTLDLADLAVETVYWPLYEIVDGGYAMNYTPKGDRRPIADFVVKQQRFKHIWNDGEQIALMQAEIDRNWASLLKRSGR